MLGVGLFVQGKMLRIQLVKVSSLLYDPVPQWWLGQTCLLGVYSYAPAGWSSMAGQAQGQVLGVPTEGLTAGRSVRHKPLHHMARTVTTSHNHVYPVMTERPHIHGTGLPTLGATHDDLLHDLHQRGSE